MAKNNIERVSSFSFPSNHLLSFQLVRDLENVGSIKPEYFYFITLAPGANAEGNASGRTYEFNNAMTLKYAVQEMSGLAFALKQYAMGNGKHLNYTKFAKSSTGQKVVSLAEQSKHQTTKNGEIIIRQVQFRVTVNNTTQSIAMTLDQTYALSEMVEILFKKGADLEFNRQINTTSYDNNGAGKSQGNNATSHQKPAFNSGKTEDTSPPFDTDDNSNFLGGGFSGGGFGNNPFS
jgi:hypothetical protein